MADLFSPARFGAIELASRRGMPSLTRHRAPPFWTNRPGRRAARNARFWSLAVLGLFAITGCGGGGGDGGGDGTVPTPTTNVWIVIDDPGDGAVLDTPAANLVGRAACPECPPPEVAFGYCPAISCPTETAISVSWRNQTNGASGAAFQGIGPTCSCLLSYCTSSCRHGWSASVPLETGPNAIVVTASDAAGTSDSDATTVSRVPPAPADVVAAAADGQVTLSWSSVAGATSYNLYWSTSRTISKDTATAIADVTSPYTHPGLTNDVTYYYLVTAVTGGYEGFASDVAWATAGWSTEDVAGTAATTDQRDTSIAVDAAHNPHVHYAYNEHVVPSSVYQTNKYATRAAGPWKIISVDDSSLEVNASIAPESSGAVHFGYLDFSGLTHAVYASGAWTREVIDPQAWCVASLVLDSAARAHAAYRADSGTVDVLRYVSNASGSWVKDDVDTYASLGCTFRGVSAAVDDAGGVSHIAYAGDFPDYGLKYASNPGGAWSVSNVDDGYIRQVSLAVDGNGKVHIVYDDNVSRLRYASNRSGAWVVETIESEGSPSYPSLAVDPAGNAHVSYYSNDVGELRYATNAAGGWRIIPVDAVGSVPLNGGADTAIALDTLGKAHVSYFSGGRLKYVTNK